MRDDFNGVEARALVGIDSATATFNKSFDLTFGTDFADDRGNIVVSANYTTRGGITRSARGGFTYDSLSDGCVTAASASSRGAGVPLAVPSGKTCRRRRHSRLRRRRQRRYSPRPHLGRSAARLGPVQPGARCGLCAAGSAISAASASFSMPAA